MLGYVFTEAMIPLISERKTSLLGLRRKLYDYDTYR